MSWEVKPLGEVCKTGSGGTPLRSVKEYYENGDIPWLLSGEVAQGEILAANKFITAEGLNNSSAKLFPPDSVLIAMYGATAGQVGILRFTAATNQAVCGIYPNERFLPKFLFYLFLHRKEELIAQAVGGAQPNISQEKIRNTLVPVPSRKDQQRIVAKLDEAFAALAEAQANVERNRVNARELFESYLNGVFEGKGEGWQEKTLKEVCEKITDGTHQTPRYFDQGIVFLSSRNVTSGKIDWDHIKYIDEAQHQEMHKRVAPKRDDILLAKNGTTGVAAIVDRDTIFDIYVSLAHLRALPVLRPRFLLHFINSPVAKAQFNKRLKGIGVPNLHLNEIREVHLAYPTDLKTQDRTVSELDAVRDQTDALETVYASKLNELKVLKKAVLGAAFNGRL